MYPITFTDVLPFKSLVILQYCAVCFASTKFKAITENLDVPTFT